ncbi:MAG: chemotaxis response regulator protein-glutamate methylesterase [Lachnospira sp.]|nr:chemotaxis response regulator protein-glutamate methylesterase [Lachnospira sp.]
MSKKVLIIDDSALMRRVISDIINSTEQYEVVEIARDGLAGFNLIVTNPHLYDVILLDINMPNMNGLELLERLNKSRIKQTIIVVSTVAKQGAKETIEALELGAFDFLTKPENYLEVKSDSFKNKLINMLDVATNSTANTPRIIKRTDSRLDLNSHTVKTERTVETIRNDKPVSKCTKGRGKLVALACSTGGPKSLQSVIPKLPKNMAAPMLIVQHMPAGFTASLAKRLDDFSEVTVKEAEDGEILKNGCVYVAPGGRHLKVKKTFSGHCIEISDELPRNSLRPCADIMYESLADCDYGDITCVVMTGMGNDGTEGIKKLADSKYVEVIAQDKTSSIVYGMPKAIYDAGMTNVVVPLDDIASEIIKNVGVS